MGGNVEVAELVLRKFRSNGLYITTEIPHNHQPMGATDEFEWDDAKAVSNEAKHGVPFHYAVRVFLDDGRVDFDASRNADGEERRKAVGMIEGRLSCVVYTTRGSVCRIISARRANAKEAKAYG